MADPAGEPVPLPWGHRYLVCPPSHFGVLYEINPWMHKEIRVDVDLAHRQWHDMVANLKAAGAETGRWSRWPGCPISSSPPTPGWWTGADSSSAGSATRSAAVRRSTTPNGSRPTAPRFSRSGPNRTSASKGRATRLPFGRSLLAGYRFRSDFKAHSLLAEMLSIPVLSVELVDARFYHLDLTFCPLDCRHAIVNPHAWDRYGRAVVERLVPEPLVLELDEALSFCANSVVIGRNIVMPACPPRVGRILEGWGFNVCVSPVTEFMKAGGGVRCLTLGARYVRLGRNFAS